MLTASDIKQQLTPCQIKELMIHLGSEAPREDNDTYTIYQSICHDGHKHKLYYYKETHYFHCYSECGSIGSIFDVVQRVNKCGFKEALDYVMSYFGLTSRKFGYGLATNKKKQLADFEILEMYQSKKEEIELKVLDNPHIMEVFMKFYPPEWENDGISKEVMEKYGIRYFLDQHKIVIPHHNDKGELVGIRGRALLQEDLDSGKKYMPLYIGKNGYNHSLKHNLYGLNHTLKGIKKHKRIILLEGEKGVLQAETMYGDDNCTVAVCGSNIGLWQVKKALSLGVEEVIFGFDRQYQELGDEECIKWQKKLKKLMQSFVPFVDTYVIWDMEGLLDYKDSPTDKGKEVFEELLRTKIKITTEMY